MTTSALARRSLVTAVGGIAALTLLAGGAQSAQASTGSTAPAKTTARAAASTTTYYLPTYGSRALMPTWAFGATHLCAFNAGSSYGRLKVQSTTGAAPEYISVPPFQQGCIDRWWWGVPVWVTNVSYTPLFASGS